MINFRVVINSDKVNKYYQVFPARTLESSIEQKWESGMPMNLSHDSHKPVGWCYPFSLLFLPGVTKLLGTVLIPQDDTESEWLKQKRINHQIVEDESCCAPHKHDLLKAINNIKVGLVKFVNDSCVSINEKDIAKQIFPEIFNNLDSDGLFTINSLKHLGTGVFEVNGLALFAHQYFRRSYSIPNNLNLAFFDYLDILIEKGIEVKIAFDSDMVGLPSTYSKPMELEYWWGPKFNNDLSKISPGVSKHKANENDRIYYGISETDFFWYSRKGEKTLEIEEIPVNPYKTGEKEYICRYIHSILDEATERLIHLDGAVRIYSEDMMLERVALDLSKSKKNTDYIKLFRIDDNLSIEDWKRVISDYFRDNMLIGEYFNAFGEKSNLENTKEEFVGAITKSKKYTPFSIESTKGFLFNYSYQPSNKNPVGIVELQSFDSLTTTDDHIKYYEIQALELVKLLKRYKIDVHVPKELQIIAYEDLYYNYPLLIINESDSDILSKVFNCHYQLLDYYSQKTDKERQISFSIEYPLQDHNIRLSFMGSAKSLFDFFTAKGFPTNSREELLTYIERVAEYLKNYDESSEIDETSLVRSSAMLIYERTFVGAEIKLQPVPQRDDGLYYEIISCDDNILFNKLSDREIEITIAGIIYNEECTICGDNYIYCPCIKVIDNAYVIVKDIKPVGLVYTDRKA